MMYDLMIKSHTTPSSCDTTQCLKQQIFILPLRQDKKMSFYIHLPQPVLVEPTHVWLFFPRHV